MVKHRLPYFLLLSLSLIGPAAAEPFEDGLSAYERFDFEEALSLWKPLAERGDARALNSLGVLFLKGQGVPKNEGEAEVLFRRAAELGNVTAMVNLGQVLGGAEAIPKTMPKQRLKP
jgi:TPR repeat protein